MYTIFKITKLQFEDKDKNIFIMLNGNVEIAKNTLKHPGITF